MLDYKMTVTQLRWDHADLLLYRSIIAINLQHVLDDLLHLEQTCDVTPKSIDDIYCQVLNILRFGSDIANIEMLKTLSGARCAKSKPN